MAEIKSKIETLELLDGEKVELTLNFARMLWLRANGYEKEVAAAMSVINGKDLDMLEMPYFYYAAYLCANTEIKYTQEEFIALVPWDLKEAMTLFTNLNSKKKVELSKLRSSAINKKAK